MKILYDTSVVFAALISSHPSHHACFPELNMARSRQVQGFISTHSLAELYSISTRYPIQPKVSPQEASALIADMISYLEPVTLTPEIYQAAIAQMVALNLPGGGIFDTLIAQAALSINADQLLTLNPKHFTRISSSIANLVRVPA
ncbi:PIN domain-containing protein [Alkalinema sp. FACHB-956]|uniref:PIN domain-containing protein n=1 Tax=Alkalinema sp. FACHB-956 TaxID=2692768 RepID=UPI00168324A5|nr:PIN domain-containing protein [Alkalinema sp. FACHB-956]